MAFVSLSHHHLCQVMVILPRLLVTGQSTSPHQVEEERKLVDQNFLKEGREGREQEYLVGDDLGVSVVRKGISIQIADKQDTSN